MLWLCGWRLAIECSFAVLVKIPETICMHCLELFWGVWFSLPNLEPIHELLWSDTVCRLKRCCMIVYESVGRCSSCPIAGTAGYISFSLFTNYRHSIATSGSPAWLQANLCIAARAPCILNNHPRDVLQFQPNVLTSRPSRALKSRSQVRRCKAVSWGFACTLSSPC